MSQQTVSSIVQLILLLGLPVYFYLALRRAYGDARVAAGLRALALTAALIPIVNAYNFLLFVITLKLMH